MIRIEPLAPGIHARSETLVEASRDHDRGRIDDVQLAHAQQTDREDLVGTQVAAGYSTLSTGMFTWQDAFRPLLEIVEGLEARTLVRFLDTNTFYRRPDAARRVSLKRDRIGGFLRQHAPLAGGQPTLACLPSPSAFVAAAADDDEVFPDIGVAVQLAERIYPPLLRELRDHGIGLVVLSDPWLQRHPEADELLAATLDTLGPQLPGHPVVLLHLPFQDAAPHVGTVGSSRLDGLCVDLVETDRAALDELPSSKVLGLGVVDARSSLVERADLLVAPVATVAETVGADRVYVTPTGDLQHVPAVIARRKLRVLGELATLTEDKVGGDA